MSERKKQYSRIANKYARDVVSGKIDACRYVKLACQRHLNDLEASQKAKFKWRFDAHKVWRACHFTEQLPHTKGEWAFKRMNITLEPWQIFNLASIFGWIDKKTGLRRFVEVYDEVPRKNGKSVLAAGVGLYCFAADEEFGAEIYSGATSEKQAWEVFRPARLMVQRTPLMQKHFGIRVNASNLNRPADEGRFEPLIGNPGDGSSPSCAIVDEYHEHQNDQLYTTMLTGMGARRQPLMFIITTAGYNIAGPCFEKRREVIEMLEGTLPNERLFGIIYTINEGDDWTDPKNLAKANPNIGVSVYKEYLEDQLQRAINNPGFANKFKTKHLNLWTSASETYFNMETWRKCEDKSLDLYDYQGQEAYLGLDLARKLDLNGLLTVFTRYIDEKRHYYCVTPKFWVPYDTVWDMDNKRLAERYQKFAETKELTVTDGAEVDYRHILEGIRAFAKEFSIADIGIDPHGATAIAHELMDDGINTILITQNYTHLSDAMKELEAAIESGRFHHDGNDLLTWNMANVLGKHMPGNDDVVRPVKEHADSKIDGAVALIMAISRAMLADRESGPLTGVLDVDDLVI